MIRQRTPNNTDLVVASWETTGNPMSNGRSRGSKRETTGDHGRPREITGPTGDNRSHGGHGRPREQRESRETTGDQVRHEQVVGVPQAGETVYLWVISSTTLEEDPPFPEEPEWRVLPEQMKIAIERELARYRKKVSDANSVLAQAKVVLETLPEEPDARKRAGLKKKVAAAERAVETLKLRSIVTLVFDKYHGAEAKKDWLRSDLSELVPE